MGWKTARGAGSRPPPGRPAPRGFVSAVGSRFALRVEDLDGANARGALTHASVATGLAVEQLRVAPELGRGRDAGRRMG